MLVIGMVGIEINIERTIADGLGFGQGDSVPRQVGCCFVFIPLEFHRDQRSIWRFRVFVRYL